MHIESVYVIYMQVRHTLEEVGTSAVSPVRPCQGTADRGSPRTSSPPVQEKGELEGQ